jgi:L-rhamnose mutarotase
MKQYVLTVDLRDDPEAIAAYREHHRRVWPEVVESLRTVGVRNMDIHLLGRRLVMVVVMEDGLDITRAFARHAASSPRVAEWERLMKSLQEPVDGAQPGASWALMDEVFRLDDDEAVQTRFPERMRRP